MTPYGRRTPGLPAGRKPFSYWSWRPASARSERADGRDDSGDHAAGVDGGLPPTAGANGGPATGRRPVEPGGAGQTGETVGGGRSDDETARPRRHPSAARGDLR